MDDLEPTKENEEETGGDLDDGLILENKKPKAKDDDSVSLDDLGDEEEEVEIEKIRFCWSSFYQISELRKNIVAVIALKKFFC